MIFLASYLAQKRELLAAGTGRWDLPRVKDLGPLLLAWGASLVVLFLERDMGASLLLFGVFVVMVWVATGRPAYLVIGVVLFAAGAYAGYLAFSHVQTRVDAWLHALEPGLVQGQAYQIAQGWFAFATGGMVGTGLGQGSPTLIPYVGSDFILAAFGEELGMLGVTVDPPAVPGDRRTGAPDRDRADRRVRAAPRGGADHARRSPGVRDRRRGAPADPLTGVPLPLVSYGGSSRVGVVRALRAAGAHVGRTVGPVDTSETRAEALRRPGRRRGGARLDGAADPQARAGVHRSCSRSCSSRSRTCR